MKATNVWKNSHFTSFKTSWKPYEILMKQCPGPGSILNVFMDIVVIVYKCSTIMYAIAT